MVNDFFNRLQFYVTSDYAYMKFFVIGLLLEMAMLIYCINAALKENVVSTPAYIGILFDVASIVYMFILIASLAFYALEFSKEIYNQTMYKCAKRNLLPILQALKEVVLAISTAFIFFCTGIVCIVVVPIWFIAIIVILFCFVYPNYRVLLQAFLMYKIVRGINMDKTKSWLVAMPVLTGLLVLIAGFMIADTGMILSALFVMVVCPILIGIILREQSKGEQKG